VKKKKKKDWRRVGPARGGWSKVTLWAAFHVSKDGFQGGALVKGSWPEKKGHDRQGRHKKKKKKPEKTFVADTDSVEKCSSWPTPPKKWKKKAGE